MQNQSLSCDKPVHLNVCYDIDFNYRPSDLQFMNKIYIADSEDPPIYQDDKGMTSSGRNRFRLTFITDVHKLLEFKADFGPVVDDFETQASLVTGREFRCIEFDSALRYNSTGLVFSLEKDGKKIAVSPVVEYEHDAPSMLNNRWRPRGSRGYLERMERLRV